MPRHTNPNPIIRDYLFPDTLTQSGVQKGLIRETFSVPYTTAAPYLCTNTHLIRGQKYLTQDTHTHTHTHTHTYTHKHIPSSYTFFYYLYSFLFFIYFLASLFLSHPCSILCNPSTPLSRFTLYGYFM